jgi:hypothetical protein
MRNARIGYHGKMRFAAVLSCLLAGCGGDSPDGVDPEPEPITSCGHAHNDYEHDRPLLDALDHGMCSVEADIWLEGGALLVAHDLADVDPARTLEALYLDPLAQGATSEPLWLLVDVKSDATATYAALHDVLAGYVDMLTQWDDGVATERNVTVIVSGARDRTAMEAQTTRYAALDGRLDDLDEGGASSALIPLVSDNWLVAIGWLDDGNAFPDDKRAQLESLVQAAHDQGRRIRFWMSPDTEAGWQAQIDAGVDLINTDDLAGLQSKLPP